jgi:hypothetical protein
VNGQGKELDAALRIAKQASLNVIALSIVGLVYGMVTSPRAT